MINRWPLLVFAAVMVAIPLIPGVPPFWIVLLDNIGLAALVAMGLVLLTGVSGIAAVILGLITVRLSGHYLPLGTIAWGIGLFYLFSKLEFIGRNDGISNIPPLSVGNFRMLDPG